MLYNVWTKIGKPMNNHEREAKRVADETKRTTPQPVPGRPGWTICDGKLSYDATKDPEWAGHIKRLADTEERKERAAKWEDFKRAVEARIPTAEETKLAYGFFAHPQTDVDRAARKAPMITVTVTRVLTEEEREMFEEQSQSLYQEYYAGLL